MTATSLDGGALIESFSSSTDTGVTGVTQTSNLTEGLVDQLSADAESQTVAPLQNTLEDSISLFVSEAGSLASGLYDDSGTPPLGESFGVFGDSLDEDFADVQPTLNSAGSTAATTSNSTTGGSTTNGSTAIDTTATGSTTSSLFDSSDSLGSYSTGLTNTIFNSGGTTGTTGSTGSTGTETSGSSDSTGDEFADDTSDDVVDDDTNGDTADNETSEPLATTSQAFEWHPYQPPADLVFADLTFTGEFLVDDLLSIRPTRFESFTETVLAESPSVTTDLSAPTSNVSENGDAITGGGVEDGDDNESVAPVEAGETGRRVTTARVTRTTTQEWESPTAWVVTQTLTTEFTDKTDKTESNGVESSKNRIGISSTTITVTNGTTASITVSNGDTLTYSSGSSWNNDDATTGKLDNGGFQASMTLTAFFGATFTESATTLPDGRSGRRYVLDLTSSQGGSYSLSGGYTFFEQTGTLTAFGLPASDPSESENPPAANSHHPGDESGETGGDESDPDGESGLPTDQHEAPASDPAPDPPFAIIMGGNGTRTSASSAFALSGGHSAGVTLHAEAVTADGEDISADSLTGTFDISDNSHSGGGFAVAFTHDSQTSSTNPARGSDWDTYEYLAVGAGDSGSTSSEYHFEYAGSLEANPAPLPSGSSGDDSGAVTFTAGESSDSTEGDNENADDGESTLVLPNGMTLTLGSRGAGNRWAAIAYANRQPGDPPAGEGIVVDTIAISGQMQATLTTSGAVTPEAGSLKVTSSVTAATDGCLSIMTSHSLDSVFAAYDPQTGIGSITTSNNRTASSFAIRFDAALTAAATLDSSGFDGRVTGEAHLRRDWSGSDNTRYIITRIHSATGTLIDTIHSGRGEVRSGFLQADVADMSNGDAEVTREWEVREYTDLNGYKASTARSSDSTQPISVHSFGIGTDGFHEWFLIVVPEIKKTKGPFIVKVEFNGKNVSLTNPLGFFVGAKGLVTFTTTPAKFPLREAHFLTMQGNAESTEEVFRFLYSSANVNPAFALLQSLDSSAGTVKDGDGDFTGYSGLNHCRHFARAAYRKTILKAVPGYYEMGDALVNWPMP